MFGAGFLDLVKPQWVVTIRELKMAGGLTAAELAYRLGLSYMSAKQYCEDLRRLGYIERSRIPRTEVGRPEIFYRLSTKANQLFPNAATPFTLKMLESARALFGDSAPERLLFVHFQQQQERWQLQLRELPTLRERTAVLTELRRDEGCLTRWIESSSGQLCIQDFHHPLHEIFLRFPRVVVTELRVIEALLGTKVIRSEVRGGKSGPARVDFEIVEVHELP